MPLVSVTQDEVLRRLEDALAFLDLPTERLLRSPGLADIVRDLGRADDLSGCRSDRRDAEGDMGPLCRPCAAAGSRIAVIASPPATRAKDIANLRAPVGGNDDVDVLADRFQQKYIQTAVRRRGPMR